MRADNLGISSCVRLTPLRCDELALVPRANGDCVQQYIKKIRAAGTQEERENIVFKELAKIRLKYSTNKKCSGAFQLAQRSVYPATLQRQQAHWHSGPGNSTEHGSDSFGRLTSLKLSACSALEMRTACDHDAGRAKFARHCIVHRSVCASMHSTQWNVTLAFTPVACPVAATYAPMSTRVGATYLAAVDALRKVYTSVQPATEFAALTVHG